MSKVYQYATNDDKVLTGLTLVSEKSQVGLQKSIIWTKNPQVEILSFATKETMISYHE
jgi:hypothetical protein